MLSYRVLASGLLALLLGGCGAGRAARAPSGLSPDSATALQTALRQVRPAFATQEEALRSGVYGGGPAPVASERRASPPAPVAAFVIQVAAYRDRGSADFAARDAQRTFPDLRPRVEEAGEFYRVALAGWESAVAAEADLPRVRRIYPGAWIRPAVP